MQRKLDPLQFGPSGSGGGSAASAGFSVAPGQQPGTGLADIAGNSLSQVAGSLASSYLYNQNKATTVNPKAQVEADQLTQQGEGREVVFHRMRNIAEVARGGNFSPQDLGKMVADVVLEGTRYGLDTKEVTSIGLAQADAFGLGDEARMALSVASNGPVGVDQAVSLQGQTNIRDANQADSLEDIAATGAQTQANTRIQGANQIALANVNNTAVDNRGINTPAGSTTTLPEGNPFASSNSIAGTPTASTVQGDMLTKAAAGLAGGGTPEQLARLGGQELDPSVGKSLTEPRALPVGTQKELRDSVYFTLSDILEVDAGEVPADLMSKAVEEAERLWQVSGTIEGAARQAVEKVIEKIPDDQRPGGFLGFGRGAEVRARPQATPDNPLGLIIQ